MVHPLSRVVGYATILIVTVLVGIFAWHLHEVTTRGHETVLIRFDGSGELIAALQPDDPVLIDGVDVGQVETFTHVPGGVRVLVRFWSHQSLFRDAYAVNTSYSLMGQRIIALAPGKDSLHPLDPGQSIPGIFDPGIAEVMSQIYKVLEAVVSLRRQTETMVRGDAQHAALHRKLMGVLDGIDALIAGLEGLSGKTGSLDAALRKTSSKTRRITAELPKLERDLKAALLATDSALQGAQRALGAIQPILDTTRRITAMVADPAGPLRSVVHDDSIIVAARKLEASLNTLMTVLEGEVPMKFRFHILGSNPSKKGL